MTYKNKREIEHKELLNYVFRLTVVEKQSLKKKKFFGKRLSNSNIFYLKNLKNIKKVEILLNNKFERVNVWCFFKNKDFFFIGLSSFLLTDHDIIKLESYRGVIYYSEKEFHSSDEYRKIINNNYNALK